jgi:inhibitor of cysteine peptidase
VSTLFLSQANANQTVELTLGDILSITLPENPTTGYRWALQAIDDRLLELQASTYSPALTTGMGGGGQHCFTFQTKAAGMSLLELKEWRDWEGDASVIKRFTITVQIQPST